MDEDDSGGEEAAVLVSVVNTSNLLEPIASSKRIKVHSARTAAYLDHYSRQASQRTCTIIQIGPCPRPM